MHKVDQSSAAVLYKLLCYDALVFSVPNRTRGKEAKEGGDFPSPYCLYCSYDTPQQERRNEMKIY